MWGVCVILTLRYVLSATTHRHITPPALLLSFRYDKRYPMAATQVILQNATVVGLQELRDMDGTIEINESKKLEKAKA